VLTAGEREQLGRWARRRRTAAGLAARSRIVLACAAGANNSLIARRLGVARPTVAKWRGRFAAGRLEGLFDEPRPGRPRTLSDERIEELIVRTLEAPPPHGGTHWSTRRMAAASGLSQSTVSRVWRTFGLQPHRVAHGKLSKDPLFVEKVRDIVGLYLDPPERAVVLCVDEKSQIQALDRTQPSLPMKRGRAGTMTHDYKRNGTTTLFAALSTLDGSVIGQCLPRHRHQEFLRFLRTLDREFPRGLELHLILDNYQTHKHANVTAWLEKHPRFVLHFTPTSSSWLNLVERWFRELTEKALRRGVFPSVPDLIAAIGDFLEARSDEPKAFVWIASIDAILDKGGRCKAVLETMF